MRRALVRSGPNNFDAIRLAMALLVIWSHSFALYYGSERGEPLSLLMGGTLNAGELGVDVFFVVSGFLIAQSFERSSGAWRFLHKRVARIYPGFLVAVAVCAFVVLPLYAGTRYSLGTVAKTFGLNLLLRGWFVDQAPFVRNPNTALNGALWSIPYEFWCYLAVLGAGVFGVLKRRPWLAIGFAIVIAAHVVFDATGKKPGFGYVGVIFGWPYLWSRMAPFFLAGTLVFVYRDRIPRSWLAAVGGVLALVLVAHFAPIACDVLQPIVIPYAALCVAFAPGSLPVARFGDLSYGTYLYAFPVQQLLEATRWFAFPAYVAASIVLSLAAGAASWHGVEKWFQVSSREPGSRANRPN